MDVFSEATDRTMNRKEDVTITYKTIVVDYSPNAKPMAAAIEEKANQMAAQGYELVTMSITSSAKAILVFKTDAADEPDTETPAACNETKE